MPPKVAKAADKAAKAAKKAAAAATKAERAVRQKEVRALDAPHMPHHRRERTKRAAVRLDAATMASLDYVRGLHFPFTLGRGVRRPDDGVEPTTCVSSDYAANVALATNGTAGSQVAMWGYHMYPDIYKGYKTLTNFTVPGGYPLTWSAAQTTPAYSTILANAGAYRPAVSMGVQFTHTGAEVSRGGEIIVCYIPAAGVDGAGSSPATLNQIFTSPYCARYSAQTWMEMTAEGEKKHAGAPHVAWFPALSDAPFLYANASLFKSGSSWTATTNGDVSFDGSFVIIGFATAGYNAAAPVVGAVDIGGFFRAVWNAEMIPTYGSAQHVFPAKVMSGSDSDVTKTLKPLEAQLQKPGSGLGSAFADWTDGMFGRGSDMSKKVGFGFGEHWFNMGRQLLRQDFSAAALDAGKAVASLVPGWFSARHQAATALGVPYLCPQEEYGVPRRGRVRAPSDPRETDAEFAERLALAVRERSVLPLNPAAPDGPPLGSAFAPDIDPDRATWAASQRLKLGCEAKEAPLGGPAFIVDGTRVVVEPVETAVTESLRRACTSPASAAPSVQRRSQSAAR